MPCHRRRLCEDPPWPPVLNGLDGRKSRTDRRHSYSEANKKAEHRCGERQLSRTTSRTPMADGCPAPRWPFAGIGNETAEPDRPTSRRTCSRPRCSIRTAGSDSALHPEGRLRAEARLAAGTAAAPAARAMRCRCDRKADTCSADDRRQFDDTKSPAPMAPHLARTSSGRLAQTSAPDIDVAARILVARRRRGADLIVMGGYGHSRLREFVLGGATRGMLQSMTVPTLMSTIELLPEYRGNQPAFVRCMHLRMAHAADRRAHAGWHQEVGMLTRSASRKNISWSTPRPNRSRATCRTAFLAAAKEATSGPGHGRIPAVADRGRDAAAHRHHDRARRNCAICARPWPRSRPSTASRSSPPARIRPRTGARSQQSEGERYDAVMDDLQMIGQRNMLCGCMCMSNCPTRTTAST